MLLLVANVAAGGERRLCEERRLGLGLQLQEGPGRPGGTGSPAPCGRAPETLQPPALRLFLTLELRCSHMLMRKGPPGVGAQAFGLAGTFGLLLRSSAPPHLYTSVQLEATRGTFGPVS